MKERKPPNQKDGIGLRSKRCDLQSAGIPRGKPSSLQGKKLFLDLKGHKGLAALENNLKHLGAVIEKCFSKEVDWLITNQGKAEDYKKCKKSEGDHERLDYAPSPFNLGQAGIDSPQAPSPNSSQATKPITRGKAIAQAANLTKTYGSSNVVDNAKRWGIRIVHIEGARKWVDSEIKRYREWVKLGAAEKKSQGVKVKRLKAPYLKFEALSETHRPVYEALAQLPELHFNRGSYRCPFEAWEKRGRNNTKKELEEPAEVEERDIFVKDQPPLLLTSERDSKAVDSTNTGRLEKRKSGAQPQLVTAGELRRRSKGQVEKQTGYCEMCNLRYDDIDKHVLLDQHRKYVKNTKNYKRLDAAIQDCLTMAQVIEELVRSHASIKSPKKVTRQNSGVEESKATSVKPASPACAKLTSPVRTPSGQRVMRSGRVTDNEETFSPRGRNSESRTPKRPARSRLSLKPKEKVCEHGPQLNQTNLPGVSSTHDEKPSQPKDTKSPKKKEVNPTKSVRTPKAKLKSPAKFSVRKSSRQSSVSLQEDCLKDPVVEQKTPIHNLCLPSTPRSSRSGGSLSFRENNRRSLRRGSVRDHPESHTEAHADNSRIDKSHTDSRTTPRKRKARRNDSQNNTVNLVEQVAASCGKDNSEVEKPVEVKKRLSVPDLDVTLGSPKKSSQKSMVVTRATPSKCDSPTQSTPLAGSSQKPQNRKVRKLTLKRSMSLASDNSMQRLLTEEDEGAFEGFDESEIHQPGKNSLSYETVTEVEADVDTMSDKEWDYGDLEKDAEEEDKVEAEKKDEEDGLDFGSVIQSIGSIGDQSEGDWDEHLESFICDQLTKKQDCSVASLNQSVAATNGAKKSPLKVVLKSPKKTLNPETMFIYLSPRKKQSPRKLVLSPVKLTKSTGKLIWDPHKQGRKPLRQMDIVNDKKTTGAERDKGATGSGLKDNRQKFLIDNQNPARNRFLSPSSGVLSPARSRLHRSLFTSPTEFEEELWSGPATDDRTKFAKEGNHYKPSTPKLSECLKENKSSTPKSYLRQFRLSVDSEGDRRMTEDESTPKRKDLHLPRAGFKSPATSVSRQDTSVYNMSDDTLNDVKVDDDISFNFSSPSKTKPSKIRRLNSDCEKPARCPVERAPSTSDKGNLSIQKDWLDDLDDPNLGHQPTVKPKSIFKNPPRTKKSFKFNYAAAAESKLPHWRKKYTLMSKAKTKPVVKGKATARPTRVSRRHTKNASKDVPKCFAESNSKTHSKEKRDLASRRKPEKPNQSSAFSTPTKNEDGNSSMNFSNTSFNTSGIPTDAPVSPRTRRNLLALVVGIRPRNKVPSKEMNTSGVASEGDRPQSCKKEPNPKSSNHTNDSNTDSGQSKTVNDLTKMPAVRVSLKRLNSSEINGRPTRACRRLLQS